MFPFIQASGRVAHPAITIFVCISFAHVKKVNTLSLFSGIILSSLPTRQFISCLLCLLAQGLQHNYTLLPKSFSRRASSHSPFKHEVFQFVFSTDKVSDASHGCKKIERWRPLQRVRQDRTRCSGRHLSILPFSITRNHRHQ